MVTPRISYAHLLAKPNPKHVESLLKFFENGRSQRGTGGFGVEIELTGITRAEAAEALAAYFETTPQRSYDNYDSWYVPDREGKQWRIMSDGSIRAEWNDDGHYRRTTDPEYRVEMVTPKLT